MKNLIHYICNDKAICEKLKAYFANQGFEFLKYDLQKLKKVQILLIVNPYKISGLFYDIHLLWKAYLLKNAPDTKLVVLNMCNECSSNNAFCLLDIPNKFEEVLSNLQSLSNDLEIDIHCFSILEQLESFFRGHHHSSLYQKFNYLEMSVKNIHYTINGDIDRTFEEAKALIIPMAEKQWQDFQNRWDYYHRFFECCPFYIDGGEISSIMERVSPFFKGQKEQNVEEYKKIKAVEGMKKIRKLLDKMSGYVPIKRHVNA